MFKLVRYKRRALLINYFNVKMLGKQHLQDLSYRIQKLKYVF